jgi:glutamine synthetase
MLEESPNSKLNKEILGRYTTLDLPHGQIIATYIWIDGTGQNVRCKDRTLNFIPTSPKGELMTFSVLTLTLSIIEMKT